MKVDHSPLILDMLNHDSGNAAEDLRQALNGVIAKYMLHPSVVISLLSRLSAGYIHLTQKYYNEIDADVVVEEDFQNMLIANLTSLDMSDVNKELDKLTNMELN